MKYMTPALAILCVALIAFDSSAEPPARGKANGKQANGKQGRSADGQRRSRDGTQRPGQQRPGADRDPAEMVARIMREFDKDGDKKLNVAELTAMMKSMRDRRGGQRPGPGANGPQGRRGAGKDGRQRPSGADGKQRRRSGEDNKAKAGGERPKRPAAE